MPLNQTKGFITLSIFFGPLANTAHQKRQTAGESSLECSQSPCQVPYEQGRVRITELNTQQDYFITVTQSNEENEEGTPVTLEIAAIEQSSSELIPYSVLLTCVDVHGCFCFITTTVKEDVQVPTNSGTIIAGMAAVIVVLVLLLLVAMSVTVFLLIQLRKYKHLK